MRAIITCALMLFIFLINLGAQTMDLKQIVEKAVGLNPGLKALNTNIKIEEQKVSQNSNLPDPEIKLGLSNLPTNSFSLTQEAMTSKVVGIGQSFPFPGKLAAIEGFNNTNSKIAEIGLEENLNKLINEIETTYYDLYFTQEALKNNEKNRELINQIYVVTETKYKVSKASQQNLFQLEVEKSKLDAEKDILIGKEKKFLAVLNTYLGQDIKTPITAQEPINLSKFEQVIDSLKIETEQYNPSIAILNEKREKSLLMKNVNEYEYYPNFNISAQYSQRDYLASTGKDLPDLVSFFVGFNIPINYGGKKSAKVEEAKLLSKYYKEKLEDVKQQLEIKIGSSLAKIEELGNRKDIIKNRLLVQAYKAFESAMSEFQVGNLDFINVLNSQKDIYKYELELIEIAKDYSVAISNLNLLVGKSALNYDLVELEYSYEK